jgi:hypothetical protein
MHTLEPYFNWRHLYTAEEDPRSPFYERVYSEFEFTHAIYDHVIHPQWDDMGSPTLFIKILYTDYVAGVAVIEMMGEWNDCINNDIMTFKRDVIEMLQYEGINKFILIGENVLNFHSSDDCYYEEWFDEVDDEDGWIALINFREHVLEDFKAINIDYYFVWGGQLEELAWRTMLPDVFCLKIANQVQRRLNTSN